MSKKAKAFKFDLHDLIRAARAAIEKKKLQFQQKGSQAGCYYGSGKNNSVHCVVGSVLPSELIQTIQYMGDEGCGFATLVSKRYVSVPAKHKKIIDNLQSVHDSLCGDKRPMAVRVGIMAGALDLAKALA